MRIYALSDLHIDYVENRRWLSQLSAVDYQDDWLLLAGDISDRMTLLAQCFTQVAEKFQRVLYVPGNHDLWVHRESHADSIEKYRAVCALARDLGLHLESIESDQVSVIAILGWYDYSFGQPSEQLLSNWVDYRACQWPSHFDEQKICQFFSQLNTAPVPQLSKTVITCSHFVPRIDLMPSFIPPRFRLVYPVLGSVQIERDLRRYRPDIHVYGHSHVNVKRRLDGVTYINNAFAYPQEKRIAKKHLMCVYQT